MLRKVAFKDWLKKYYPVGADQVSKEDSGKHVLQKWTGARPEVLREYGLEKAIGEEFIFNPKQGKVPSSYWLSSQGIRHGIEEISIDRKQQRFYFTSKTCAWCVHFSVPLETIPMPVSSVGGCVKCPGYKANLRKCENAWNHWVYTGEIDPMLEWICKGVEWQEKESRKQGRTR
jgi:hypothetical protein